MKFCLSFLTARKRWQLDYYLNGVRYKPVFKTKELAEAQKISVLNQVKKAGEQFVALKAHEREEMMAVAAEAKRLRLSLRQLLDFYVQHQNVRTSASSLKDAFARFLEEKEQMRLSLKAMKALRSNVGRFVAARENAAVHTITRDDVMHWLQQPSTAHDGPFAPRTFNTYLTSLNTFFKWCATVGYITKAPTTSIPKIREKQMPDLDEPPVILSVDQVTRLLNAAMTTDRALIPYVAVGLFAGLRPEREARRLAWPDVEDEIAVRGLHAKDRQRRHVEIHPTLAAWLAVPLRAPLAGPSRGDLPVHNLRRRFEKVRTAAGLIRVERAKAKGRGAKRVVRKVAGRWMKKITNTGWSQDCLRHTFASCYLPVFGAEKTIAQLGHGDYEMLFGHYRNLVKREEAERFWALTPERVLAESRNAGSQS